MNVQEVHGVAGRDGTVSVRCILVLRRLHIQSSRERSEVEHFRDTERSRARQSVNPAAAVIFSGAPLGAL